MGRPKRSIDENFKSKIQFLDNGCWQWIGKISKNGYGHFTLRTGKKYKTYLSHRLSYEIYKGQIPTGMTIDHLCVNKSCVNPLHLRTLTRKDNILVSATHPCAINARKKFCKRGHEFTQQNTYSFKSGNSWCRQCKQCVKERYIAHKNICAPNWRPPDNRFIPPLILPWL